MEERIQKIAETEYGQRVFSVTATKGGVMNTNFKVETDKGFFVFRIYNKTTHEAVQYETDILKHLEDKKFPAIKVVLTQGGAGVVTFENRPAILYQFIEGNTVEKITPELLQKVGAIVGQLHVCLSDFNASDKHEKDSWDPEPLRKIIQENAYVLKTRPLENVDELILFIKKEIAKYTFPALPSGVTHQDIKPENIILNNGEVVGIIDFDNNYFGNLIHDLTTTIIWTCFDENGALNQDLVQALVRGYETFRPLTDIEKKVFADAIRWRLLREIFIGPYVTEGQTGVIQARVQHFRHLYDKNR